MMQSPPDNQIIAGKVAREAIQLAKELCRNPIDGLKLDKEIETFIRDSNCEPALKGYHPSFSTKPYEWTICLGLDKDVVHGVPLKQVSPDDLITVDLVVEHGGLHADTARTFTYNDNKQAFVLMSKSIFEYGKQAVIPNQLISLFGKAVQDMTTTLGYGVVQQYCGHAIGRQIHAAPQIPNYPALTKDKFECGQAYAVEPVLAINPDYQLSHDKDDGFTVRADCLISHFEDTLFIGTNGVINLTGDQQ